MAIVAVSTELSSASWALVTSVLGTVVVVVGRWVSGARRFLEFDGYWANGMMRLRGRAVARGFLWRLAMERRVADSGCVEG